MKINKTVIVLVLIPLTLAGFIFFYYKNSESAKSEETAKAGSQAVNQELSSGQAISPQYTDNSIFLSEIKRTPVKPTAETVTGLIVPHHLLAAGMMADTYAFIAANKYKNIVLLSPDHYQTGKSEVSTTERNFSTVFGTLGTETEVSRQLKKLSFVGEGDFFYREHGLQAQLPFIKYYFPEAKTVAITFKPTVSKDELDQVIAVLEKTLPTSTLIIESTDFSHYLTPAQAELSDKETLAAINQASSGSKTENNILSLKQPDNLDSVAALYIQANLQKYFFEAKPQILGHKNSQDYTAEKVSSSTSYVTAAYLKSSPSNPKNGQSDREIGSAKFIFVGDIMLSRHIGEMMDKRQDYDFPFATILPDLSGADLVFGNLESPISSGGKSTGSLYSFRADPRSAFGLKDAGFTVLSVANNHAFDYGREAFSDTLVNLKKAGLDYAGGGPDFLTAHAGALTEINGIKTTFLAYTDLLPKSVAATEKRAGIAYLDEIQMVKDIKAAKEKSDLVIVSFHWGREYETASNERQKKIAAEAVKAGASLIVGHHPHVAQEIAEIQGAAVAYSLGNFVFDQNFSPETKNGLMLEVNIRDKKILSVRPQTIRFNRYFQPYRP